MKITTQRTLLWTANFAVAAGLILLVVYFAKSASKPAISSARNAIKVQIDAEMRGVRPIRPGDDQDAGADVGDRLKAPFDPTFHYMGYVPPPPEPDRPVEAAAPKAPPLNTLLEISFLVAPARERGESGEEVPDEFATVALKLKSLPATGNVFVYREGATIGIGEEPLKDVEPTLKRHGGAKLLRILPDGVVVEWVGETVKVDLIGRTEASTLTITDAEGKAIIGGADGAATAKRTETDAPRDVAGTDFFKIDEGERRTTLTLTEEGFSQFSGDGEKVLDGIEFERAKSRSNRDALKIGKIPSSLSRYGLQDGDIIVSIDGKPVTSKESIVRHVKSTYRTRSSYNVVVERLGGTRYLSISVPPDLHRRNVDLPNVGFGTKN